MKFLVLVKLTGDAARNYEDGKMPERQDISTMLAFNKELVDAGVMLDGQGLHPTSKGLRVSFGGDKPAITDGPFAESKELIGGYWIWNVSSREEAVQWVEKCPMEPGDLLELRQMFEMEDFGDSIGPEEAALVDEMAAKLESAKAGD